MEKKLTNPDHGFSGLGPQPTRDEDSSFGAQAPAEYSGHPADGSNPSISMPSFPPSK